MTIWAYEVPTTDGSYRKAHGCPVTIYIETLGWIQVVYQFGLPDQACAVVHWQSGQVIASIGETHQGYPQQRAQAAWDERYQRLPERARRRIAERINGAPVINTAPSVVGVMK
jgi:hypothetical protein